MNNLSFSGQLQFIHFVAVSAVKNIEFGCDRQPLHAGNGRGQACFAIFELSASFELARSCLAAWEALSWGGTFNGWSGEFALQHEANF
jgi:hypothetical protein